MSAQSKRSNNSTGNLNKNAVPAKQTAPTGPKISTVAANQTKDNTVVTKNQQVVEDKNQKTTQNLSDTKSIPEMKTSFLANPHVQADEEAEYYENVRRLDVCGRCWTEQRKYYSSPFKLKEKGPGATIYQKDYVEHPLDKGPAIKNDFYGTFNIEEPIDFGTTMKNDYKPWKIEPSQGANQGKTATGGIPFAGKSGYKGDFIDWGTMPVDYEKAPNSKTVISELPFVGKSAYQENYTGQNTDPSRPLEKSKNKSPLSPGIPFLGQTTNMKTYKPYKVGGAPMFVVDNSYEPTEAYPNQYKTMYKQDYTAPGKWKCPAVIYMETHPHPRLKTLKP